MAERSPPDSPAQQQVTAAAPPPPPKHTNDLNYMHRPPRIVPNYGKKHRGMLPKSNISRVLLYDNVTQQQMLDVKISHLRAEQRKTGRLMDMHRKSVALPDESHSGCWDSCCHTACCDSHCHDSCCIQIWSFIHSPSVDSLFEIVHTLSLGLFAWCDDSEIIHSLCLRRLSV